MNLKVRVKNPVFWVQIVLSILTPVLAYAGLTAQMMLLSLVYERS